MESHCTGTNEAHKASIGFMPFYTLVCQKITAKNTFLPHEFRLNNQLQLQSMLLHMYNN